MRSFAYSVRSRTDSRRVGVRELHAWMLLALLACSVASHAAELPWRERAFQTVANDKPLADFLRDLAASQGTTAVIDPKVGGTISGKFSAPPLNLLNSIAATNGLSWYYDGAFLFIDPSSEARSEVLSITPGNASRLFDTLARLKILDRRFPFMISDRDGTVHVTGPRRYIEMVRQAVRLVDQASGRRDVAEIRLFPLKYAWAGDFKVTRSGREVAIPGVANTLRSLYGREGNASRAGTASVVGRRPYTQLAAGADRQLRLSSGDTVNAPRIELPTTAAATTSNRRRLSTRTASSRSSRPTRARTRSSSATCPNGWRSTPGSSNRWTCGLAWSRSK